MPTRRVGVGIARFSGGVQSIVMSTSVCLSLSVCLSARVGLTRKPHNQRHPSLGLTRRNFTSVIRHASLLYDGPSSRPAIPANRADMFLGKLKKRCTNNLLHATQPVPLHSPATSEAAELSYSAFTLATCCHTCCHTSCSTCC